MPQQDPGGLAPGDTLRVQVRFRGRALAGTGAHAGAADPASPLARDEDLTSDSAGAVRVPIRWGGLWNVRTAHVVQTGPAAWDTHWTTFVFRVGR